MPQSLWLHVSLDNRDTNPTIAQPSILSITMSKLVYVWSLQVMLLIMPHYNICDGYRWEEIIDKHLPKLKVFRFRIRFDFYGTMSNKKNVDKLVDSFPIRFWIGKHKCSVLFYTLSYTFNQSALYYVFIIYAYCVNYFFMSTITWCDWLILWSIRSLITNANY